MPLLIGHRLFSREVAVFEVLCNSARTGHSSCIVLEKYLLLPTRPHPASMQVSRARRLSQLAFLLPPRTLLKSRDGWVRVGG